MDRSNFSHQVRRQNRMVAESFETFNHVLLFVAQVEMGGIAARRVVTVMKHKCPVWDLADARLVNQAMNSVQVITDLEEAITTVVTAARVVPAPRRLDETLSGNHPEHVFQGHGHQFQAWLKD